MKTKESRHKRKCDKHCKAPPYFLCRADVCVSVCVCGGGRSKLFTDRRSFRPSCSDSSSTRRCGCHQSRGESARTRRRVHSRAPVLPDGRRWRERCSEWWRDWSDSIPGQCNSEKSKISQRFIHLQRATFTLVIGNGHQ